CSSDLVEPFPLDLGVLRAPVADLATPGGGAVHLVGGLQGSLSAVLLGRAQGAVEVGSPDPVDAFDHQPSTWRSTCPYGSTCNAVLCSFWKTAKKGQTHSQRPQEKMDPIRCAVWFGFDPRTMMALVSVWDSTRPPAATSCETAMARAWRRASMDCSLNCGCHSGRGMVGSDTGSPRRVKGEAGRGSPAVAVVAVVLALLHVIPGVKFLAVRDRPADAAADGHPAEQATDHPD